jgi:hypothetical protein
MPATWNASANDSVVTSSTYVTRAPRSMGNSKPHVSSKV